VGPDAVTREVIYSPAWWVPGAHLQTLWGKLFRRQQPVSTALDRWNTPDGDFLELHRLRAAPGSPRMLILHGLEGSVRSHYAQGLLSEARKREWAADLLIFRSCGSEPNRAKRFYHSGETEDLALVVDRILREFPESPLAIVGVSLGGNVVLKFLGERGDDLPAQVKAAAAISVPFDLAQSSKRVNEGFSRVYQRFFLSSLKMKAAAKAKIFPDIGSTDKIAALQTLEDFDDLITGPLHGFSDAQDYYARSSSISFLSRIRIKTLLLSAVDDPMLPPSVLTEVQKIAEDNPFLETEFVQRGGHAGFVAGSVPWRPFYYAEHRVGSFFADCFRWLPETES
jgi:uncharacterized protein